MHENSLTKGKECVSILATKTTYFFTDGNDALSLCLGHNNVIGFDETVTPIITTDDDNNLVIKIIRNEE